MKRLGKFPVWSEGFLNGVSSGPPKEEKPRVVYEQDGKFYVNYFDSKKLIERRADGTFYAAYHCREVKARSFAEILTEIQAKTGGGPITVVGLPSNFGSKR